jgi:hypothetical protein
MKSGFADVAIVAPWREIPHLERLFIDNGARGFLPMNAPPGTATACVKAVKICLGTIDQIEK